jgi:hypothetical protein
MGVKKPSKTEGENLNDSRVFCRINLTVRKQLFSDMGSVAEKGAFFIEAVRI